MSNPFSDDVMAAGYAAARPPVHPRVIALMRAWLGRSSVRVAADLGCGAGLSTRPLVDFARVCVGFDPAESMVRAARRTAPQATFMVAAGEAIPLPSGSVDVVAAAGSLNYARDLDAVWPEVARVLARGGTFVVYDFSPGRSLADDEGLDHWYESFLERYPRPAGQARPLSPAILNDIAAGFVLRRGEEFAMPLPLSASFYVEYMLTETNVQHAVRRGTPLDEIRTWCTETLAPVFGGRERDVVFRGYLAHLQAAR
jgi:SAM-dependent methyltransferase